jgi:hypothetical protein
LLSLLPKQSDIIVLEEVFANELVLKTRLQSGGIS